jgi:DNA-binding SARP family transcriptional activator
MLEMTKLRINVLGTLDVALSDGRPVQLPRGCASLLGLLVLQHGRPISREVLVEYFWPDSDAEQARAGLRQRLYLIRRALEQFGLPAEQYLLAGRDTVQLDMRYVTSDIEEFSRSLANAEHADSLQQRIEFLTRAISLYGGDVAAGCYEDCFVNEQGRLSAKYRRAVAEVISLLCDTGDIGSAIECAHRSLAFDPLDEDLHMTLMRLYAAAGQPAAVARQFCRMRSMIENELGETIAPGLFTMVSQLQELARHRFVSEQAAQIPIMPDSDDNKSCVVAVHLTQSTQVYDPSGQPHARRTHAVPDNRELKPALAGTTRHSRVQHDLVGSLCERTGPASYRSSARMPLCKDACLAHSAK